MKSSISRRVLLIVSLINLSLSFFVAFYLDVKLSKFYEEEKRKSALEVGRILADEIRLGMKTEGKWGGIEAFKRLEKLSRINSLRLYSPEGKVFLSSPEKASLSKEEVKRISSLIQKNRVQINFGDGNAVILLPLARDKDCIPCHGRGDSPLGMLEANLSWPETFFKSVKTGLYLGALLVATLATFLIWGFIEIYFAWPFRKVLALSRRLAQGASSRISLNRRDEIGELVEALNAISRRTEAAIKEVERAFDEIEETSEQFSRVLSSTTDLRELISLILQEAFDLTGLKKGSVMWSEGDKLKIYAWKGYDEEKVRNYMKNPLDVFEVKAKLGRHSLITEIKKRGLERRLALQDQGFLLSFPLQSENEFGVLNLVGDEPVEVKISTERRLLVLAKQGGLAISKARVHDMMRQLAMTDSLTGLYNHRYFDMRFKEEFRRAQRYKRPLSLILFDIDDFKHYNDMNGHLAGDELLEKMGAIVRKSIRNIDIAARYGGEEFVVILPETEVKEAVRVGERLRQEVEREHFSFEHKQPGGKITISVGVSAFPGGGNNPRGLLDSADKALYEAKLKGKNVVVVSREVFSINKDKDVEDESDYSSNE